MVEYFKNRVAIVTGGASGMGRALCEELGEWGSVVVVADVNAFTVASSGGSTVSTPPSTPLSTG